MNKHPGPPLRVCMSMYIDIQLKENEVNNTYSKNGYRL